MGAPCTCWVSEGCLFLSGRCLLVRALRVRLSSPLSAGKSPEPTPRLGPLGETLRHRLGQRAGSSPKTELQSPPQLKSEPTARSGAGPGREGPSHRPQTEPWDSLGPLCTGQGSGAGGLTRTQCSEQEDVSPGALGRATRGCRGLAGARGPGGDPSCVPTDGHAHGSARSVQRVWAQWQD